MLAHAAKICLLRLSLRHGRCQPPMLLIRRCASASIRQIYMLLYYARALLLYAARYAPAAARATAAFRYKMLAREAYASAARFHAASPFSATLTLMLLPPDMLCFRHLLRKEASHVTRC